jgi:hypothetical protein
MVKLKVGTDMYLPGMLQRLLLVLTEILLLTSYGVHQDRM